MKLLTEEALVAHLRIAANQIERKGKVSPDVLHNLYCVVNKLDPQREHDPFPVEQITAAEEV